MALLREIKLILDFNSPTIRTLTLHQYDKNSTNIIVTCMDNGVIKKIDKDSVNAYLKWHKSDGNIVLNDEVVNSDGTITIECTQQMLMSDGKIDAELCLINSDTQEALHTMPFFVVVKRGAVSDEDVASTSEYTALVNALIEIKDAQKFADRFPEWEQKENERQENEKLRQQNTSTAIENCENAMNNAISAANGANETNETAKGLVSQMTKQLETVTKSISDANSATEKANNAANGAITITSEMSELKSDIEEAESIRIENENVRQSNEIIRQQTLTSMKEQLDKTPDVISNCENATERANTAAINAENATKDIEEIISGAIPSMTNEFIDSLFE